MAYTGTFQNYPISGKNFGLYCEYSYEQDVAENSSTITLKTYLAYATLQVGQRSDSYSTINSDTTTFTAPAIDDLSGGDKKKLINTKTLKVYHNADGTKSCNLSASWRFSGTYSGTYINRITAQVTVSLHTIDRLAIVNSTQDLVADVSNPILSCNVSIKNASHNHKLQLLGANDTLLYESDLSNVSGEVSINLPTTAKQTILKHMANTANLQGKVKVLTYKSGSLLGSTEKTINIKVENSKPFISRYLYSDPKNILNDSRGEHYVQRLSDISVTIVDPEVYNYATIKKYYAQIGDIIISSSSNNLVFYGIDPQFQQLSGSQTLRAWIEDSRGFTDGNTYAQNVEILPYQPAQFTSFEVYRVNGIEETIHVKASGRYSAIEYNGENKNQVSSITVSAGTQQQDVTSFATISDNGTIELDVIPSSIKLDIEKDFEVLVTVKTTIAGFTTLAEETVTVPKGKPLISFRRGKIGINKIDPEAGLDVEGGGIIDGGTVWHGKNLYIESGAIDITPTYTGSEFNETVSFNNKFPSLPQVFLSFQARVSLSQTPPMPFVTNRSTTSFTLGIFPQKANQAIRIHWLAIAIASSSAQTLGEVENIEEDENL